MALVAIPAFRIEEGSCMVAQASPKLEKVVVKLLKLFREERARMLYEAQVKQERDDRGRPRFY